MPEAYGAEDATVTLLDAIMGGVDCGIDTMVVVKCVVGSNI